MKRYARHWLAGACAMIGLSGAPAESAMIVADYSAAPYKFGDTDVTAVLKANFECAMFMWRSVFPTDVIKLTIEVVALDDLPLTRPAGTAYLEKDATTGRVTKAGIAFNNKLALTDWFFDPTPQENGEFMMTSTTVGRNVDTTDEVNNGRFGLASADAAKGKFDFFSIAIHEIGHALGLGFNDNNPAKYRLYEDEVGDSDIDIDAEFEGLFPKGKLPFKAIQVDRSHFDGPGVADLRRTSMAGGLSWQKGIRVFPSDLDILGIASVYDLKKGDVRLDPRQCPEPGTLVLLGMGTVGALGLWRRERPEGRRRTCASTAAAEASRP